MKKNLVLVLLFAIALSSCKNSNTRFDHLEITQNYYKALDTSNESTMAQLLTDSLLTRETEYDYEQVFSKKEYLEWLKWDAIFAPTYEVLSIEQDQEMVKAQVSKVDTRIRFLHEEPIITNQVFRFERDKIVSIETIKYVVFNDSVFTENRGRLLRWIDENHPELNGFIFDQTETGGKNYLKALELYKKREQ